MRAKPFSTEDDIAKFLQITPRKLRKLRLLKEIPCLEIDRYTRLYHRDAVIAALELKMKVSNALE
jgi:hypothetical protein